MLVYVLYLLFQLKSHAYLYESTPQHRIDEESHPGVLADVFGSSSSSDSSSTSDSDTDTSSGSHTTAGRFKRRFRRRKRRKSSSSSKDTPSVPSADRSSSSHGLFPDEVPLSDSPPRKPLVLQQGLDSVVSGDEADTDGERDRRRRDMQRANIIARDFESEKVIQGTSPKSPAQSSRKKHKKSKKSSKKSRDQASLNEKVDVSSAGEQREASIASENSQLRVGFVGPMNETPEGSPKRPFTIRNLSASVKPALPKVISSNVFSQPTPSIQLAGPPLVPPIIPRTVSNLRRTSSLPDRLNQRFNSLPAGPVQPLPHIRPSIVAVSPDSKEDSKKYMSRRAAIILLLVSTGLVAICAEFLVESIDYLVSESGVSQAFIGLIILPIVGNAAEHVTAVTVASKNKMDLAIGVAVGSSIQIALFVTPIIVLLGWCLDTEMSLYFSLFETVSLFVSAFIVGFLILDGTSNYLEGALLIAAYVIIAVLAFFYPSCENLSISSGPQDSSGTC